MKIKTSIAFGLLIVLLLPSLAQATGEKFQWIVVQAEKVEQIKEEFYRIVFFGTQAAEEYSSKKIAIPESVFITYYEEINSLDQIMPNQSSFFYIATLSPVPDGKNLIFDLYVGPLDTVFIAAYFNCDKPKDLIGKYFPSLGMLDNNIPEIIKKLNRWQKIDDKQRTEGINYLEYSEKIKLEEEAIYYLAQIWQEMKAMVIKKSY